VPDAFHARFSARGRRYRYVLHNHPVRPALLAGKVGWFHLPLDAAAMHAAAAQLLGTHDYSSFRSSECQAKTPVKTVTELSVVRHGDYLLLDIRADGFLHHMVRNIVGALVFVGKGARPVAWLGELLRAQDRSAAPPMFMADGLYLTGIEYGPEWPLPDGGRIIAYPPLAAAFEPE
jgi:tRNA pseudouridine38-40 synthase